MKKMNLKSPKVLISSIVVAAILLIGVVWGTVLIISHSSSKTNSSSSSSSSKVISKITGKSIDDDRKDALSAVQDILKTAYISPTGTTSSERMTSLDSKDYSVIDDSLNNKIRFEDSFADSEDSRITTLQSLISIADLTHKIKNDDSFSPYTDTAYKNVYVDQEIGQAYVPLSSFLGTSATFSFEMVYVDGEWKLTPYSLIEAIKFSAAVNSSNNTDSLSNSN